MRDGDGRPSGLIWRMSSYSGGNGECVECAVAAEGQVWVRDSKDPEGAWLSFSSSSWLGFVRQVQEDPTPKG